MPLSELALIPSSRTIRWCDRSAAAAIVLFAVLGTVVGMQLSAFTGLHATMLHAAGALEQTGRTVALLGELPFVGNDAARLADQVRATADGLRADAGIVANRIQVLAVVVGIVIAAIPLLPVVLFYAPLKRARRHELRRVRQLLAGPPDPALVEHLARAATQRLSYQQLCLVSSAPWLDLARGNHAPLASAELHRLGIEAPPWLAPAPTQGG
jgi:hypothetical protein